jgi:hypothetical protein
VFQITNTMVPVLLGTLSLTNETVRDIAITTGYAYLATRQGVVVVDISNPRRPTYVRRSAVSFSDTFAIDVADDSLFVRDSSRLGIFSIEGGTNFQARGSVFQSGYPWDIKVKPPYAYIASETLEVIDISTATNPIAVRSLAMPARPLGLTVRDDLLFAACGGAGVQVLSITDPSNPQALATLPCYDAYGVSLLGPYCFVADGVTGLKVFDISAPRQPVRVGANTVVTDYMYYSLRSIAATDTGVLAASPFQTYYPFTQATNLAFTRVSAAPNRGIHFELQGIPGFKVSVDKSTSLGAWTNWRNVTLQSAPVQFTETNLSRPTFYRAYVP